MSDIKVSSPRHTSPDPAAPVTPHHQIRSTSVGSSHISMSDRSPAEIKRKLEQRLADTKTKMYNIGILGESLVKQEKEWNERIKELEIQAQDEELRPELRSKLSELESGFKEIERESAKAFSKTIPFLGKQPQENIGLRTPGQDSPTKSEFIGHGTISPSKSQSSPRKARNATPRQHDIEFAADIGQGLLEEVRKLQALLAQRDQKLGENAASMARSDRQLELFDRRVKQMHEDAELLKEENWNMHLRGQELQNQLNSEMTDSSKLQSENARLVAQVTTLTTALDSLKVKNVELSTKLSEARAKHEGEMSALRRAQAGLQRDRSDLQRNLDELKIELSRRPVPPLDAAEQNAESPDSPEQELNITPSVTPTVSPQLSPIKNTPSRNAPLELETTKSSLHHAHRMVTNLRNTLYREKTEKLELKKLLAAAQDEVEQLRSKASGSKRAAKRPQMRRPMSDMLGNKRRPEHEVTINLEDSPQSLTWRDEDGSTSAPYVTANEHDCESDSAFVTATEHEIDGTDTEYRTGVESQADSDGEFTETEANSTRKMPSLGKIREFSLALQLTSDEDDSPVRPTAPLRHRRSTRTESGRRLASSQYDPPPQPLFQELMEGGGSSVVNSPRSVTSSPTSVGTAIPLSSFLATREAVETLDIGCQCDPTPDPEPIILEAEPVIIYKEPDKPVFVESSTQSDPIPNPEPIVVEGPTVIVYKEPELPTCNEISTQCDPIPDPDPVIIYREPERPECVDNEIQTDSIPPPEPIIIRPEPIIIPGEPVIITEYVEKEKPESSEIDIQTDPIPPPAPIIICPDPVIIQAEPVVVIKHVEPEKPSCDEAGVQSDPLPPPAQIIIYKEPEKPVVIEMAVQSDPIPEPEPIVIASEPLIIYKEKEPPMSNEAGIQSDEVGPTIVYVQREKPPSTETGIQAEVFKPEVNEFGVQAEVPTHPHHENAHKEIQTLLSIPLSETFHIPGQQATTNLRPKTPLSIVPPSTVPPIPSRTVEAISETSAPKIVKTLSSTAELISPPKSPLREITNSRRSEIGSPSRSSSRFGYADSPTSFSSRIGSARRYGTILEHPTLHPSPRSTVTKSRVSHPLSPSKMDQRRQQTVSPSHSRMNMSIMSRSTTAMSRRTSISSFESELDNSFGLTRERTELGDGEHSTSTDPHIIQAITQTMIGEVLWKYTRSQMQRSKISDKRHPRFFWIHPYTKTLYWSTDNPAVSKNSNRNTRSAPIKRVAVVTDENPFPPGLFRKSILCFTPSRAIKFTARNKQSHETWLRALNHLLDRGPMMEEAAEGDARSLRSAAATTEYSMDMREFGAIGTRRITSRLASMSTTGTESELDMKHQTSFGRLSSMFRGDRGTMGTMSTVKGKGPSIYEASMVTEASRYSHEHTHDDEMEGVENVRACCGGKHDVGTLARKGKHSHK